MRTLPEKCSGDVDAPADGKRRDDLNAAHSARALTVHHQNAWCACASNLRHRAILMTLYSTGMRRSEFTPFAARAHRQLAHGDSPFAKAQAARTERSVLPQPDFVILVETQRGIIPSMAKKIILCSDGTGNTFESETNVSRMVKSLSLEDQDNQLVVYDQGLGTAEQQSAEFRAYFEALGRPKHLIPLVSDPDPNLMESSLHRAFGLTVGLGLKENVKQLYTALAQWYEEGDFVYLFGFSRGAFTVRVLAGLLYRCWLEHNEVDAAMLFDQAWRLYEPLEPPQEVAQFRKTQRACPIHLMGLWDTVKSYGIIHPVMLPHLRHNPIVTHIRHALALHEHRAFFQHTTWGLLDNDATGAMQRLRESMPAEELASLEQQRNRIREVWFDGCHSDIGGGNGFANATIALRWMLGEAVNLENADSSDRIRLSRQGEELLASRDPNPSPDPNQSRTAVYAALEELPRWEIDNSGKWPERRGPVSGSTGRRDPDNSHRQGKVFLHETVRLAPRLAGSVERCRTQELPT